MSFEKAFDQLSKNPDEVFNETVRLLSKIADNIINNPTNLKVRTLQKNNSTIFKKILCVSGGQDCLKCMGFKENNASYTMESDVPLNTLKGFKNALINWSNTHNSTNNAITHKQADNNQSSNVSSILQEHSNGVEMVKKVKMPLLVHIFNNPFLRQMEVYSHQVLQYEDKDLQNRAKKILPLVVFEENAQRRLRSIQKMIKTNKLHDPDLSVQDTLLLELLSWFKNEFFQWMNSPDCEKCGGVCEFDKITTDEQYLIYTDRVEVHKCKNCNHLTPFPRYNDLNILLETRRGRCGEWANVFTLFCRSLGWDARLVVEEGDHIWTEVYSITQKRWVHCDPCENACDTPLMYETGWNKKLSYIIAYSAEEIQDVTWRYSCKHKEVMKRRYKCTESELLNALITIRKDKMKNLSDVRKNYLTKRLVLELVEFLTERKPGESDVKGRISGSAAWRLARGEIQTEAASYVWLIDDTMDLTNKTVSIRYFCASDKYECTSGNKKLKQISKWNEGTYSHSGIFRKEEHDWKNVYLATNESEHEGAITWKFDWKDSVYDLDSASLYFEHTTFENGVVNIKICSGDTCIILPKGSKNATLNKLGATKELTLTATLVGGMSWQHAQLFRQLNNSNDCSFNITLNFK